MKRSSSLTLVLLATTATVGIAAGIIIPLIADDPSPTDEVDPIFANVDECTQAFDGALCRDQAAEAKAIHEASAPKFEDKQACEASYGTASCVATQTPPPGATASSGGGWFMPAMAGFLIARSLSAPPTPVYYGQPPGGQNCGQPGLPPCPTSSRSSSSSSSGRGVWTGNSYVGSYSSGTASNTGTAAGVRSVSTAGSGASAFAGSSASRSSTTGVASSSSSSRGGFGASASSHSSGSSS